VFLHLGNCIRTSESVTCSGEIAEAFIIPAFARKSHVETWSWRGGVEKGGGGPEGETGTENKRIKREMRPETQGRTKIPNNHSEAEKKTTAPSDCLKGGIEYVGAKKEMTTKGGWEDRVQRAQNTRAKPI